MKKFKRHADNWLKYILSDEIYNILFLFEKHRQLFVNYAIKMDRSLAKPEGIDHWSLERTFSGGGTSDRTLGGTFLWQPLFLSGRYCWNHSSDAQLQLTLDYSTRDETIQFSASFGTTPDLDSSELMKNGWN